MSARGCNKLAACVALVAICAAVVIASGIWFASAQGAECARLVRWPVVILGVAILLAALAGLVGAYWDNMLARFLLISYFIAMLLIIGVLVAFLVLGSVVTSGSGAYPVPGRAYDEYRLDGFSTWLRKYVSDDPARWEGILSCLADSDTCKKLARQGSSVTADQFYRSDLTPLQSGCCKPPAECGFGYVGPTAWTTNPTNAAVQDCGLWSNDPAQLCYECESCRAGVLAMLRNQWRKARIALAVATVVLVLVYVASFIAYRFARK